MEEIEEIDFKPESEIKRTVVDNFGVLFPGLELIASEFTIGNKHLDALAFDDEKKTFVIIEYKTKDNHDIKDQVSIYYDNLLQSKAECINALNEKRHESARPGDFVKMKDISWDKPYLILVRPEFSKSQIQVSNSMDQRVTKLYEIRKYPNHLTISQVNVAGKEQPTKRSKRTKKSRSVARPVHSEADWLAGKCGGPKLPQQIRDLYYTLKESLLAEFHLEHVQKQRYATFDLNGDRVCRVDLRKNELQITYSTDKTDLLPLNDFVKAHSTSGIKYGIGHHRSYLSTKSDVSRALEYVDLVCKDKSGSS